MHLPIYKLGFVSLLVAALLPLAHASFTLGNSAIGGSFDSGDSNFLNGSRITTGSSGVAVTSLSVYVGGVDAAPYNQYQLAIYQGSGSAPGARVAVSSSGILTANAWNTLPLTASLQANSTYWLIFNANGRTGSVDNMRYTNGAAGVGVYSSNAVPFGTWPATFGSPVVTNASFSLYLTGDFAGPGAPQVAVTAPAANQVVGGTVDLTADAFSSAGIAGIRFQVDYANFGAEDLTAPYSIAWNTSSVSNGTHVITAIARAGDGATATSASVNITVSNGNQPGDVGQWGPVMNWPLVAIHATLLHTGKVLLWDEEYQTTHPLVWDPVSENMTSTPALGFEIWCSGQTALADGTIFAAGGHLPDSNQGGIKSTHRYDPVANTWTRTADMAFLRWYPASTRLSDGRIAIVSGQTTYNNFADSVELYNPGSGSISLLPNVDTVEIQEEEYPADFLLPSGKVLVISPQLGPVQLLDVNTATWTRINLTPLLLATAVQYRPGKIMMSGGGAGFLASSTTATAVLDMNAPSPAWRTTTPMSVGRYMHNLVILPTGDVLAIGGSSIAYQQATSGPLSSELWKVATETWTPLASMGVPRMYHSTALLLPDGRVLAAGGGHNGDSPTFFSGQVFSPPYLFKGSRPTLSNAPGSVNYGAQFSVDTPDAASITSVALIGFGAATHSTDVNQSYDELTFTPSAGHLTVTSPADSRRAPPGYYMLFLVNSAGVPSVSKTLLIGSGGGGGGDTTPPTVSAVTPTSGSSGIAVATTVTAAFSESLNSATVGSATFALRGPGNVLVTSTVSYDSGTSTATLTPASPLTPATAYTATLTGGSSGIKDSAGNALAANFVWSFTTAASTSTTVGLTTVGTQADDGCSNFLNGSQVTTNGGGGIQSLSVYVGAIDSQSANRSFQLAIYSNGSNNKPGSLLGFSTSAVLTANAWNTVPLTVTLQPATTYWLIYNTNGRSSGVNNMYYNSGVNGKGVFSTAKVTFGTWPATFPSAALTSAIYSIYGSFGP